MYAYVCMDMCISARPSIYKHTFTHTYHTPPIHTSAFAAAVDWSEVWVRGLVAFHALLWVVVLLYRRNMTVQVRSRSCWFF